MARTLAEIGAIASDIDFASKYGYISKIIHVLTQLVEVLFELHYQEFVQ